MCHYFLNPNVFNLIDKKYIFRFYTTDRLIELLENIHEKEGISVFWLCGTYDVAVLDLFNSEAAVQFLFSDKKHFMDSALTFVAENFFVYNGLSICNQKIEKSTIEINREISGMYEVLISERPLPDNHEYIANKYLLEDTLPKSDNHSLRKAFILISSFFRTEKESDQFINDVITTIDKEHIIRHFIQGSSTKGVNFLIDTLAESHVRDNFIWNLHVYAKTKNIQIKTTTLISLKTFNDGFSHGIISPMISARGYEALSFLPNIEGINNRIPIKMNEIESFYTLFKNTVSLIKDQDFKLFYQKAAKELLTAIVTNNIEENSQSYIRCAEKLVPIISAAILSKYGGIEYWDKMSEVLNLKIRKNPLTLGKIRRVFEEWVRMEKTDHFDDTDLESLNVINETRNKLVHLPENIDFDINRYMNGFTKLSFFISKNLKYLSFMSKSSGVFPHEIEQTQNPTIEALAQHIIGTHMVEEDEAEFTTGKTRGDITFALGRVFGHRRIKVIDIGCGKGAFLYGLSDLPPEQLKTIDYVGVNHKKFYQVQKMIEDLDLANKVNSCEIILLEDAYARQFHADYSFVIDVMHEIPLMELDKFLSFIILSTKINGSLEISETRKEAEEEYFEWNPEDFQFLFKGISSVEVCSTERIVNSFGKETICCVCSIKIVDKIQDIIWADYCQKLFRNKINRISKLIDTIQNSQVIEDIERKAQLVLQQNYLFKQIHKTD